MTKKLAAVFLITSTIIPCLLLDAAACDTTLLSPPLVGGVVEVQLGRERYPVGGGVRMLGRWVDDMSYEKCAVNDVWTCRVGDGVGLCGETGIWVVIDENNMAIKVETVPGPAVSLKMDKITVEAASMAVLPPMTVISTDTWGNPSPTDGPELIFNCIFRGIDDDFAVYGTSKTRIANGFAEFTDIALSGSVGTCDIIFSCDELNPDPASYKSEVKILLGEPTSIDIAIVDPEDHSEYHPENASVSVQNNAFLPLKISAVDHGGNAIPSYPLCGDHNLTVGVVENCVFVKIEFEDDVQSVVATVKSVADVVNGVFYVWVPQYVGGVNITGELRGGRDVVKGGLFGVEVVDRGQFQCVRPKYGAMLLEDDLSAELLDGTTMDEISRTFFDLSVPPPPFVRFNISSRNGQDWHLRLPANFQYWVLMKTPFYIEIDPVLSVYFCFGFSYARVDDLAINLKKPFCDGSELKQVVAELAILLFDLGDASAQYHKNRGAFSGTTGTARFGNFTGFIPKKEQLAICVGDRILSPATTGYHVECCDRVTGKCQEDSTHTTQTIIIVVTTVVTTFAATIHVVWIVKCLHGTYRCCLSLEDTQDVAQRAKVIAVHCISVVFPLFSIIVNREFVYHFHPLIALWIFTVTSIGFWTIVCLTRLIPGISRKTKYLYDAAVVQLGYVSLWLIWAAWTWSIPSIFLETRRTLVPFTCFSTLLAHCILKPGVISNFPAVKVSVIDSQDMLLDSLISTVLFAGFLTGLVYALNSFTVVTDTQMILAVIVVLGVGIFMSWSLSGRFAAALRRTVSESAEKAGAIALDMVNKHRNGEGADELADAINDLTEDRSKEGFTRKPSTAAGFDYRKFAVLITGEEDEESPPGSDAKNPLQPSEGYNPPVLEEQHKKGGEEKKKKGILKGSGSEAKLKRKHSSQTTERMLANLASEVITDVLLTPSGTPRVSPRRGSDDSTNSPEPVFFPTPKKKHSLAALLHRSTSSAVSPRLKARTVSPLPELPPPHPTKPTENSSIPEMPQIRAASLATETTSVTTLDYNNETQQPLRGFAGGSGRCGFKKPIEIPPSSFILEAEKLFETGTILSSTDSVQSGSPLGFHIRKSDLVLDRVVEGSPAESGGLTGFVGSKLLDVNGTAVETVEDVARTTENQSEVTMTFDPTIPEEWTRPAPVLTSRRKTSSLSCFEGIPKVDSLPSPPVKVERQKPAEIDVSSLGGTFKSARSSTVGTPLASHLGLAAEHADKIFGNLIDAGRNLSETLATNSKPPPPQGGGWVEGGTWNKGKWVPPSDVELQKQSRNNIGGQLRVQVRQLLDEAEGNLGKVVPMSSPLHAEIQYKDDKEAMLNAMLSLQAPTTMQWGRRAGEEVHEFEFIE